MAFCRGNVDREVSECGLVSARPSALAAEALWKKNHHDRMKTRWHRHPQSEAERGLLRYAGDAAACSPSVRKSKAGCQAPTALMPRGTASSRRRAPPSRAPKGVPSARAASPGVWPAVLRAPGACLCRVVLSRVFDEVVEVNLADSADAMRLALLRRPELGVTLTKLHCWTLTRYSKCVFLDADTLVSTPGGGAEAPGDDPAGRRPLLADARQVPGTCPQPPHSQPVEVKRGLAAGHNPPPSGVCDHAMCPTHSRTVTRQRGLVP